MKPKTTYVALLRAINVGGRNLIKMQELARIFRDTGFQDARTYIQSGNVIFSSSARNSAALTSKIERALQKELGYPVIVILRKLTELEALISREPFKKFAKMPDVMLNAIFFKGEPKHQPKLPFWSDTENLEIFEISDGAAFVVSHRKKNGWFGFPNAVVEKQLGVVATTRQWKTVKKIVLAAVKGAP